MLGKLSVVSTPIGNIKDITVRALEALFNVETIICEDTRVSGNLVKLLKPYYISLQQTGLISGRVVELDTKLHLVSMNDYNEDVQSVKILTALSNGVNIALISDAGTPLVSDPGYKLVRTCIEQGIEVEVIPGVSSVTTALVKSGLPPDKFLFVGYPPRKPGNRMRFFEKLKKQNEELSSTIIMFEAPHKLVKSLEGILEIFGNIDLVLCRELTKIHEESINDSVENLIKLYSAKNPKGEYVVLFNLSS